MTLYRYIIRELIAPFFSSMAVIVFIFVMQQAVLLLDKIISKGLDPLTVLEIFAIQLAWMITLAIPMSILVATLVTFGRMSGDNELTTIKASGINLWSLITPVFALAAVLCILNIYFNDLILPEANHRTANLLSDISRKHPTAFIEPKVLVTDFQGYVIYTEEVNHSSGKLRNICIFTNSPEEDPSVTIAESGYVRITPDQKYIELTLYNGETHSVSKDNKDEYFIGNFKQQVVSIKNVESKLERTNIEYRGDREKSISMLLDDISKWKESNQKLVQEYNLLIDSLCSKIKRLDSLSNDSLLDKIFSPCTTSNFNCWINCIKEQKRMFTIASIRSFGDAIERIAYRVKANKMNISQYMVEVHKKFSIPFACIVFVFVGAPLGIMARRGGLAVGASYSLFFFIIHWITLIIGEPLADKLIIPPWVAMWSGNIIIGIVGIILIFLMLRETKINYSFLFSFVKWIKNIVTQTHIGIILRVFWWIIKIITFIPNWILYKIFKILPVYLIRIFIQYAAGVLIAIIVIFISIDYVDNFRRFESFSYKEVILYYWYYLPWIIQITIPIVLLLASMFSVGQLAKHGELVAVKAAGINFRQFSFPLLLLGVIITIASFYGGEMILPKANRARVLLLEKIKNPKPNIMERVHGIREFRRNFFYFGDKNNIYMFQEFITIPQTANGVVRQTIKGNRIVQRIFADKMIYDSTAGWKFVNATVRDFSEESPSISFFDTLEDKILKVSPSEMVIRIKSPEEMSYWELKSMIEAAKKRGEKVQKYLGELEFKLALPVMNFIVILVGISITARTGRKGGAVLFGIGLALVFSFWILSRMAIVFAQNGYLSVHLGAWLGNVIFFIIGLMLYRKANRV
ncbi:MAG: LptF/LptG family permease [Chitinispirillaceae bacterium]|nr:LptF/LptG family permease [Chitinispirillaceae bacterium]